MTKMSKDKLIKLISNHSSKYGDMLLEMLDKYDKFSLNDLTYDEVFKFCKEKRLIDEQRFESKVQM